MKITIKRCLILVVLVATLVPLAGLLFCLLFNINPVILHPLLLLDGLDYAHARRAFEKQFPKPIATQEAITKLLDEYDRIKGKSSSFNWRIRVQDAIRALANNPETPHELLAEILRREFDDNLTCVDMATNFSATPELLDRLAEHPSYSVCSEVISNPKTSPKTLQKLYFNNPKRDFYFRGSIASDSKAPAEVVSAFLKEAVPSDDPMKRRWAAGNPRAALEDYLKLSKDPETTVRLALARNPAAPKSVLESLSHDVDFRVSKEALDTIQKAKKDRFTKKARDFACSNKAVLNLISSVPEFHQYDIHSDSEPRPNGGFEGYTNFRVTAPSDHKGCLMSIRWRSKDCDDDFLPLEVRANDAVIWRAQ